MYKTIDVLVVSYRDPAGIYDWVAKATYKTMNVTVGGFTRRGTEWGAKRKLKKKLENLANPHPQEKESITPIKIGEK